VVNDGDTIIKFFLVKDNFVTVVSERIGVRLVDLHAGSFFGEYQILF